MATALCKYDLRKGDLFVLSWARVQRVRPGSISSELHMCGGGGHSILLLSLVARCLETIDVCIWRMFVFMSVVIVWGSVGMFLVYRPLLKIVGFEPWSVEVCCMFVNAGRGCKRRPYGRGILQSRSHDCIIGSHECLLLFIPSCCCECFYHL